MIRVKRGNETASAHLRRSLLRACIGSGATLCVFGNVHAAEPDAQPTASDDTLQEVVVISERRSVDVQKIPGSVVAFTAEDLQEKGVNSLADLQSLAPSLTFQDGGLTKFINIRGIGLNEAAPYETGGVASYLDGAFIAREFTADDAYFDLQSVQVLRGPQGTYVGQNSTGGAIFADSNLPVIGRMEGYGQIRYGAYSEREAEGAVSVPVTDDSAARVSVLGEARDSYTKNFGPFGYGQNPTEVNQPGNLQHFVARLQWLYKPSDDLQLRFIVLNSNRNTDGIPYQYGQTSAFTNPYQLSEDFPNKYDVDYTRYTGILDWKFVPTMKVHIVSAYQDTKVIISQDGDGTSPYVSPATAQQASTTYDYGWYNTNELDLVSELSGPFQWTVGVTELDYNEGFSIGIYSYNVPGNPSLTPNTTSPLLLNWRNDRTNHSGFGEVSYDVTPKWQVKLGVRYNSDDSGLIAGSYVAPFGIHGPHVPAGPVSVHESAVTGRVLVNYQLDDDNFLYATINRGYKPGSWSPNVGTAVTAENKFGDETVMNYELGWKANLFNHHMRLDFDVFDMNYQGYQATIATDPLNPTLAYTTNVNGTKIRGVELDLESSFAGWLFNVGGSYLDAKYGQLSVFAQPGTFGPNQTAPQPLNLNGRQIDYAPKVSGNAALAYKIPVGGGRSVTPRLQWTYTGQMWTSFYDAPEHYLPAQAIGTFRLGFDSGHAWRVEAFISNLTDRLNMSYTGGSSPAGRQLLWGAPRTWGLQANISF